MEAWQGCESNHTGKRTSASPGKALRYEMSAPLSMKDLVTMRSSTLLWLALYRTATDKSFVVDMGEYSVPPYLKNAGGAVEFLSPR